MEDRLIELLEMAIKRKASDIHISIIDDNVKIECRISDELISVPSISEDKKLIKYLQFKSNLDMGNLYKPASGRFDMYINNQLKTLRFSVIYSKNIINGVIRILNYDLNLSINNLSYDKNQTDSFKEVFSKRHGLILLCGPTSSGKTTTIYTMLNYLKDKKIYTIEDPIEIVSLDYIQLQVNQENDYNYDACIKQVLRHDPDIIMVGEIRDELTAKMVIRATLTGHLVISSIHAYDPISCLNRLKDLNIDISVLYDTLDCIINQRLFESYKGKDRRAIYEIFNKEQIQYYIKKNTINKKHKSLNYNIEQAIKQKTIKSK